MNGIPLAVAISVFAFHAHVARFNLTGIAPPPTDFARVKLAKGPVARRAVITSRQAAVAITSFIFRVAIAQVTIGNRHVTLDKNISMVACLKLHHNANRRC